MPDFLKQLPYDITCFIFSFISQRDCIECMRVNHSWNEMIPSAISPNLWTVLDISGGSWRKRSACLLPFLGYVRTLYITPSSKMDRELVNIKSNGCTVVNSLGK
ncbi:hypothetical protein BDA99DRAFT_203199 [Phascolomyces articulosus]|uniref:F-box domain-containing protein n=1 Tax=Phascolomyces articulosus TaxID=60185 RepID=A0AAD5K260_9FUNG|nr:hypothetical protein BDA99DRAFT_203199 [Phascolomyces articulosus]